MSEPRPRRGLPSGGVAAAAGAAGAPVATSRFRRLANTHACMAAGDAAMTVALADSVLFSLDADAARSKVLLFLGVSFVPFLVVAPLIGPAIDRLRGGRRMIVQGVAVVRILVSVLMAFHADDVLLFPLAFVALVMQKTYTIAKSALVPSVVRTEEELVEANSKLGLISGLVGAAAVVPAGVLQQTVGPTGTLLYGALWFGAGLVHARRLPREAVATKGPDRAERAELSSPAVVIAATAMTLLRATVGFTFFHLYFWFSRDEGFAWFGVALGASALATMAGNSVAPMLRDHLREEVMLVGALVITAVAGIVTALVGGVVGGVVLAASVNLSASIGRLAFDSIVQRDAPDANHGRAFARFETRFQLGWVFAGVVPVLLKIPGRVGFIVVGAVALAAAATYHLGGLALARGREPFRPTAALRHAVQRRGAGPEGGRGAPLPPPRSATDRRRGPAVPRQPGAAAREPSPRPRTEPRRPRS